MKNFIVSFLLIMSVWLLLNASLSQAVLFSGIIVALLTALFFSVKYPVFRDIKLNPKAIIYMLIFTLVFIKELIKSNLDVARRVVSPSIPINPGIVEIKTNLKSEIGRLILANSITLTPGTLTVEMKDESLFIHWIDVLSSDKETATREIAGKFEKYLGVIYG